jgi:hypothetical protein
MSEEQQQLMVVIELFAEQMRAAAEASMMAIERIDRLQAEMKKGFEEASAERKHFAEFVHGKFDKVETRLETFAEETGKRFDKVETRLESLEELAGDTQPRLKRIEGHLQLTRPRNARTPPRATRTPTTKRYKKS